MTDKEEPPSFSSPLELVLSESEGGEDSVREILKVISRTKGGGSLFPFTPILTPSRGKGLGIRGVERYSVK
jgi:hypothetical protein